MDEPVAVEHTHEPLVTEEVFYRVGERLKGNCRMQKCTRRSGKAAEDIFGASCTAGSAGADWFAWHMGKRALGRRQNVLYFTAVRIGEG